MKRVIDVQIPSLPNFIKVGNEQISVGDFTDKELKQIGKEWTETGCGKGVSSDMMKIPRHRPMMKNRSFMLFGLFVNSNQFIQ